MENNNKKDEKILVTDAFGGIREITKKDLEQSIERTLNPKKEEKKTRIENVVQNSPVAQSPGYYTLGWKDWIPIYGFKRVLAKEAKGLKPDPNIKAGPFYRYHVIVGLTFLATSLAIAVEGMDYFFSRPRNFAGVVIGEKIEENGDYRFSINSENGLKKFRVVYDPLVSPTPTLDTIESLIESGKNVKIKQIERTKFIGFDEKGIDREEYIIYTNQIKVEPEPHSPYRDGKTPSN